MSTLREFRTESGVSQAEFSRRMDLSPSTVSRIERGQMRPWPKFRRDAAHLLGVDETVLFADAEDDGVMSWGERMSRQRREESRPDPFHPQLVALAEANVRRALAAELKSARDALNALLDLLD
jgi:transcriptional regulator with XRE-family HTH domain